MFAFEKMSALGLLLSSFLVLSARAAPAPAPAMINLAARDGDGVIKLCVDFNAGGRCENVGIPASAIVTNPLLQGFSAFKVDGGQLCTLLGGCPSSAQLVTPGLTCNLSNSFSSFTGCGALVGDGNQIQIKSGDPFRNFDGPLNDNLSCMQCTKN